MVIDVEGEMDRVVFGFFDGVDFILEFVIVWVVDGV